MIKKLQKNRKEIYYYKDNIKILGIHDKIRGDVSGISGDVSGISGDVSEISGDVNGIRGDVSGISGDVDLCEITEEERLVGIDIKDLINVLPNYK